jgi:hypothetical protein
MKLVKEIPFRPRFFSAASKCLLSSALVLTLGLTGCATPQDEAEVCNAVTVILGPINAGPPKVETFEKSFEVLDILSTETENPELRQAIIGYSDAGKIFVQRLKDGDVNAMDSFPDFRDRSNELILACTLFLYDSR